MRVAKTAHPTQWHASHSSAPRAHTPHAPACARDAHPHARPHSLVHALTHSRVQVALISRYVAGPEGPLWSVDLPMGPPGLVLPLAIFCATLVSLRIGFGAVGSRAAPADDWVGG